MIISQSFKLSKQLICLLLVLITQSSAIMIPVSESNTNFQATQDISVCFAEQTFLPDILSSIHRPEKKISKVIEQSSVVSSVHSIKYELHTKYFNQLYNTHLFPNQKYISFLQSQFATST